MSQSDHAAPKRTPHVIAVGNEKGGTGKSTTAMHVAAGFMASGFKTGTIDLDARQGTLSRYVENRQNYCARTQSVLPMPQHQAVPISEAETVSDAKAEESQGFEAALAALSDCDVIVIDTPGRDSHFGRLAVVAADQLITPINDSFIDLDVLGVVDPETLAILHPSKYAETVFQQKIVRAGKLTANRTFDWVVIRNRMSQLESKNRRAMDKALETLADRVGFRVAPGFSERVIFRELFLDGLTLLDLRGSEAKVRMNLSHVAARNELRALLAALGLNNADL